MPNCWRDARIKIQKGKGSFAHYGLPLNKPNDRHKWFFNSDDAINFFNHIKPENFTLNIVITEPERNIAIKLIRKIIYSKTAYRNKFCQTVWAEYKKIDV